MKNILNGEILKSRKSWASEIVPGSLWLGSANHASDLAELKARNITRILNVADDVENYHTAVDEIKYENLHVRDFGSDPGIRRVFTTAFNFLQIAKEADQRVLVHCAAGANRSATIVIAWIMYSQSLSLLDAWNCVKAKKRGLCPMNDNRKELLAFERELFGGVSSFPNDEAFLSLR